MTIKAIGQRFNSINSGRKTSCAVYRCSYCSSTFVCEFRSKPRTRSCGCIGRNKSHSMSGTPTYKVWLGMVERCTKEYSENFPAYGGSGIAVCEKWLRFEGFLEDMGVRPDGMTIDRINNENGYSKDNCRWASWTEQANNRSNNRILTIDGVSKTMAEWSRVDGAVSYNNIKQRVNSGYSHRDVVFMPLQKIYKKPGRLNKND